MPVDSRRMCLGSIVRKTRPVPSRNVFGASLRCSVGGSACCSPHTPTCCGAILSGDVRMIGFELRLSPDPLTDPIPVLIAARKAAPFKPIVELFDTAAFVVHAACTCHEAQGLLDRYILPVVLTECTLPDGDWTRIRCRCEFQPNPAQVIVHVEEPDPALWVSALACGAFDVLHGIPSKSTVERTVHLAYRRWRRGAEQLKARQENLMKRAHTYGIAFRSCGGLL